MHRAIISFFFVVLATLSNAQSEDDFGFPSPLDIETQRALLGETFPAIDIGGGIPRLDALIAYRRDLEIYRVTRLEAFNARIQQICRTLVEVERRVNSAFNRGDLSPNEKERYDQRISDERNQCSANDETISESRYYSLYRDFLGIYQAEANQSFVELERCYANDLCRERDQ